MQHGRNDDMQRESDENLAAWEAGIERIADTLRARFPELFDEDGKLITERAMDLIRQRAGGKRRFTREEFIELTGGRRSRRADASKAVSAGSRAGRLLL